MNRFESTVSALAYAIIRERCATIDPQVDRPENRVASFVLEQHGRMAGFLRFPLAVLTVAFDAWGLARTGRCFRHQDHARRWAQVEAWRSSSIGPCRDLIRFYESLVVFGCHALRRDRPGRAVPGPSRRPRIGVAVGSD